MSFPYIPLPVLRQHQTADTLDGNVILWVQSDRPGTAAFGETADESEKEHWRLQKMVQ